MPKLQAQEVKWSDWIEFNGDECPLPPGTLHRLRFRDGDSVTDDDPDSWIWDRIGGRSEIVAYAVLAGVVPKDEQPAPVANSHPAIWPLVIAEMEARDKLGRERYGVPLQPHNGRDTLRDAYEEALDLCAYLRAAIYERDGK